MEKRHWVDTGLLLAVVVLGGSWFYFFQKSHILAQAKEAYQAEVVADAENVVKGKMTIYTFVNRYPNAQVTEEMCHAEIARNTERVQYCPGEFLKTEAELIASLEEAVGGSQDDAFPSRNIAELILEKKVPPEAVTPKVHVTLMAVYPRSIERVMKEVPRESAEELLLEAFNKTQPIFLDAFLGYIPGDVMSQRLANAFFARSEKLFSRDKMEPFVTLKMARAIAQKNPEWLQWIPEHLYEASMGEEAVRKDPKNLRYVPFPHRTLALCRLALANSDDAFDDVPKKYFLVPLDEDAKGVPKKRFLAEASPN